YEVERREREQRVKRDVPLDSKIVQAENQLRGSAELDRIAGDCEIALCANACRGRIRDIHRDPLRRGEWKRRRAVLYVESTDRKHEIRIITKGGEHPHLAFDGHEQHAGFEEGREEVNPLTSES